MARTRSIAKAEALATASLKNKMKKAPCLPRKSRRLSKKLLMNKDPTESAANHVLGLIFRQLPVADKFSAELVSKKWQTAARYYSWSKTYEIKEDDFVDAQGNDVFVTTKMMRALFERCGRFVRKLNLENVIESLDARGSRVISKFMTALTHLSLANVRLTQDSLRLLKPLGPKLKILDLSDTFQRPSVEKGVADFVGSCTALEKLCIGYNRGLRGEYLFNALPATLKKLHLSDSPDIQTIHLAPLGKSCPQLVELKFTDLQDIEDPSEFNFLYDLADTLEVLVLRGVVDGPPLFQIADLKKLKRLDMLESDGITTELLVQIGKRCKKLEDLRLGRGIWRDESIEDEAFNMLGNLPELRILQINGLDDFADASLEIIARRGKLEKVCIAGCIHISNTAIQATILNCQELKRIEVRDCGTNRNLMRRWCRNVHLGGREMPIICVDGYPLP